MGKKNVASVTIYFDVLYLVASQVALESWKQCTEQLLHHGTCMFNLTGYGGLGADWLGLVII